MVLAQGLQVLFVLFFAPLLKGYMDRLKARGMRRVGPPVLQPYRNLWKWFGKESLYTTTATELSRGIPLLYFSAPLLVALLIPVLTTFPLPLAFLADMLGGGMILAGASLLLLLYALDSGSPYSGISVSRVRLISVMAEPLTLMSLFTAASVAHATIPYVVNQTFARSTLALSPSHLFLMAAWFLLILAEAGRIPVDNPDSGQELSLIDPNRLFEASGPDLAFLEWGSWMKFTILGIILVNVLATPFGLSASLAPVSLLLAILVVALKLFALGSLVVLIELGFAKLRLMRIVEYLATATSLAFLAALFAQVR